MTKVYIGPSIEGILQTGAAFKGGYPPRVAAAIKNAPYLEDLMAETKNLANAKKELRNPESGLQMLYRRAEEKGGI